MNVELPINRIFALYVFIIVETFLWGFSAGVLYQPFHVSFHYLGFISKPTFGLAMMISAAIAAYNLWRPILYKELNIWIATFFLLFCLFHRSFITLGYLTNKPVDGAWGRNFAEVLAIAWVLIKSRLHPMNELIFYNTRTGKITSSR